MVRPKLRTRSYRRVKVRTPGGEVALHFEKRKPGKAVCSRCGNPLGGVPHQRPSKLRGLSKSKKRPNRPYGGVLCSTCLAELISAAVIKQVQS